jgi:hypothetical protein
VPFTRHPPIAIGEIQFTHSNNSVMKKVFLTLTVCAYFLASCGENKNEHSHDGETHGHEQGTHEHEDGSHHENHDEEHHEQEEFNVNDTSSTHSHDHSDHSHTH